MKIGLALPHYDFSFPDGRRATIDDVVTYAQRAEALGFDEVWVSDHLFFDLSKYGGSDRIHRTPEAVVMLAAIAAATNRVRFGPLVLNCALRNARGLLQVAESLLDMGAGRFDLGLGAGWYEPEFEAAGVPFPTAGARMGILRDALATMGPEVRQRAPLWVGGKGGPKLMSLIAEHADGWNISWQMHPTDYADKLDVLARACDEVGRDPATIQRSVGLMTIVGDDREDANARLERAFEWAEGAMRHVDRDWFIENTLIGPADVSAARIKEFEALGVDQIIFSLGPLPFAICDDEQVERAAALANLVR